MQGRSQHWLDAQSRPAVPAFVASILTVIALLCGSAFAQQAAPIPNGLTHWWRAENNGADTQGGLGTVLGNGATFTANGKVGAAFFFPGTTANNVSFGNQLGNFGTADFTVDFWMQTTNTGSQALLSKRAICNPDSFFDIRTNRGGAVNLEVELDQDSANTNYNLLRIPVDVSDGVFHHIAVTRQGVTVSVYLDGALIGQQQTAGITNISNAALFTLGQSACSGSPDGTAWFDGTLDELHIFNRALSQNEVQSIYNAGSAGLTTLVGWWKFNEGTGAATADSSGNGNTGVLSGSPLPTWSSAGPTGAIYFPASLSFDGVSSYVDVPNAAVSSSLNFASQLTVAAWVKPAIPFQQGAYGIISRPNGSAATGWALRMANGGPNFVLSNGTVSCSVLAPNFPFAANAWTHVAATYDVATSTVQLYVNGVSVNTDTLSCSGLLPANVGTLQIGEQFTEGPGQFAGLIDDARVYNRVLSSQEIATIAGAAPVVPITACGTTITAEGVYSLQNDLLNCPGDGIDIQASNVNLNLNGHTISGQGLNGALGILVGKVAGGISNVAVLGPATISNFSEGFGTSGASYSYLTSLTSTGNGQGVVINQTFLPGNVRSAHNVFNNIVSSGNQFHGFTFNGGDSNTLRGNQVTNNGQSGIFLYDAQNNTLNENIANGNGEQGILAAAPPSPGGIGNLIQGNTALNNALPDLEDDNVPCANTWTGNVFGTVNQACAGTRALLTVTANNQSRLFGADNPPLTYTITGFLNGDTEATSTDGTPALSTTATPSSPAGSYPIAISQGSLVAPHYDLQFVNGTLTVQPVPVPELSVQQFSSTVGGYSQLAIAPSGPPSLVATANSQYVRLDPNTGAPLLGPIASSNYNQLSALWVSPGRPDLIIGGYQGWTGTLVFSGLPAWGPAIIGCCTQGYPFAIDAATGTGYAMYTGSLYVINLLNGGQLPGYPLANNSGFATLASPTVLFAGGNQGVLNQIDPTFHSNASVPLIPGQLLGPGAVAADGSFVVSSAVPCNTNQLQTYPPCPGSLARVIPGSGGAPPQIAWVNPGANAVTPPVIGRQGYIFVGVVQTPNLPYQGEVRAYDLNGALRWIAPVDPGIIPSDLLLGDDGKVYVVGSDGPYQSFSQQAELLALDQTTGQRTMIVTNTQPCCMGGAAQIILWNGVIYVAGQNATAIPVPALGYDPQAPWPVRFHDNQRTSNFNAPQNLGQVPRVNVSASPNPAVYGQTVTLTANVGSGGLGGTVTFTDGGSTFNSGPVSIDSSGLAQYTASGFVAGSHTITATYSPALANGTSKGTTTLVVTPAVLTITPVAQTKFYGDVLPPLSFTIIGFVNGDTSAALTGAPTLSTVVNALTPPGTYPIFASQGSLAGANYTFAFGVGTLTISPAASVSLPATEQATITQGGAPNFADTYVTPYGAAQSGWITTWQTEFTGGLLANGLPGVPAGVQLKVFRSTSAGLQVVAQGSVHDPRPDLQARFAGTYPFFSSQASLTTFSEAPIPVMAGDLVGITVYSDPAAGAYSYPLLGPSGTFLVTRNVLLGQTMNPADSNTVPLPHAPALSFTLWPGNTSNPLSLQNNYFVTGDYSAASVVLRATGQNGIATGSINVPTSATDSVNGVPVGADILAAYLYWETLENTPEAAGNAATFRGYSISGQKLGNDLQFSDGALTGAMRVYRADVLAYLPVINGVRVASGAHSISLPDSGNPAAAPLAEGATLVVIYRVMSPNFPLKAVVLYDGAAAPTANNPMLQVVQGYYDPAAFPAIPPRMTSLFTPAGGSWSSAASTPSLSGPTYGATLSPGAWAGLVLSTPVNNSDHDGILDAWKSGPPAGDFHAGQPGYYDAKFGQWIPLPGAARGQRDLFVQMDYMCDSVLPDGTCDPAARSELPVTDSLGRDPLLMLQQVFAKHGIALHLELGNAIQAETCTDNLTANPPQLCEFPGEPGVVNWKLGVELAKLWPRNAAGCIAGGDCSPRFPYGAKDSYHYVLMADSLAIPAWNTTWGTLTSISVSNHVATIVTADRGAGSINACPSRITISGVLGNPALNGTYTGVTCNGSTTTMIVNTPTTVPDWTYPNNTLPEPVLGVTSGTVSSISGFSDLGGADTVVSLAKWETSPNQDMSKRVNVQVGTILHEIGHTLGLSHGGTYLDQAPNSYAPTIEANCKTNYQSVMNYLFQIDLLGPNHVLELSNQVLPTISEGSASALKDFGNADYATSSWYAPLTATSTATPATRHCDGSAKVAGIDMYRVDGPVNDLTTPFGWSDGQDVNYDGQLNNTMRGYNDWANVDLRQVGATSGQLASLANLLSFSNVGSELNVGAGGTLALGSGGTVALGSGGTVTLGSAGTVTLSSGGTITVGGAGGTVSLANGGTLTLGSAGTITMTNGGSVVLGNGGTLALGSGGTVTLGGGGAITLGSGGNVTLGSGGVVALGIGGTLTIGAGGSYLGAPGDVISLAAGGTLALGSGGTLTLGSAGSIALGSGGTLSLGSGGTLALGSGGTVALGSGGTLALGSGGTVSLGSGGTIALGSGGTLTLGSGGNVTLGSGGTVTLGSGGNVALGSGGNVSLGSGGTVALGSGGNVTLGSGGTVTLGSGGTISLGSGGTVTLGSGGNVTLGSGGTVALGSGGTLTLGSGGTLTLGSGGNVTLGSGGLITLSSGGTLTLGSGGSYLGSAGDVIQLGAGGNVSLGSGGTLALGSGGNITLGSGGTITMGSGGNVTLGSGGTVTLGSGGTITMGSGGTVSLGSGGNVTLGSGGTLALGSGGNITLGSGGNVTLGSGGTLALGSGGNTIQGSGGTLALGSGGTVALGSGGTVTLGSGGNVTLGSGGTVMLASGGTLTLGSGGSYLGSPGDVITVGSSGGTVTLGSGGTLALGSGGNVALGSGGTVALGSGGNVALGSGGTIALGSGGNVTLGSGGTVTLGSGGVSTDELTYDTANSVVRPPDAPTVMSVTSAGVPAIQVNWTAPQFGVVTSYAIYRSVDGGAPVLIGTVSGNPVTGDAPPTTFLDTNPATGTKIVYTIATNVTDTTGGTRQSPPSVPAILMQTITFGPLASAHVGDDVPVSATASSGLPVSFAAAGPCSVTGTGSNSATVNTTAVGSCTVTASQSGGMDMSGQTYAPAVSVSQSFSIMSAQAPPADQTISFPPLGTHTFGDPPFTLVAMASSNLPVTYVVSGNCALSGPSTLQITGAGSCSVTASQAGNDAFNPAIPVTRSFAINSGSQTITMTGVPASTTYGAPPFTVMASASSGLPVSLSVSGNCLLSGNTVSTTGAGNCTVTASQAGNANYNPAPNVQQVVTINPASTATMVTSSSPNPSDYDVPVTFSALVTAQAPSLAAVNEGVVAFYSDAGSTPVCSAAPLNGAASCQTTSPLAVSSAGHVITAAYSDGGGNFHGSPSTTQMTQVVNKRTTTLAVTFSPASPVALYTVTTVKVTVTDSDPNGTAITPGGTITLTSTESSDQFSSTSCTLDATGSCSVTVTPVIPDGRYITAVYGGDSVHLPTDNKTDTGATNLMVTAAINTQQVCLSAPFNGTPVAAGNYVWFNSVFQPQGQNSHLTTTTHITFYNQTISIGNLATINLPDAEITLDPSLVAASTSFDRANNTWVSAMPVDSGKMWLGGATWQVPSGGLPGGVKPVTWCGFFSSDNANLNIGWQWAAAAYTKFDLDYNNLLVKPLDGTNASNYPNTDKAGTPEAYKSYVTGGARSGGGTNYTGGYSGSLDPTKN